MNNQRKNSDDFLMNFSLIKEFYDDPRFGVIDIYVDNTYNKFLFEKQIGYDNQEQFQISLFNLKQRENFNHDKLLELKSFTFSEIQGENKKHYQINAYYTLCPQFLNDIYFGNLNQDKPFSNFQLKKIFIDITEVLFHFSKHKKRHGDLRLEYIGLLNGNFILNDRLSDTRKSSKIQYQNLKDGKDCYLSPLLFQTLIKKNNKIKHDPYKSEIFSLGLIVLQCGLLNGVQRIYDKIQQKFNGEILKELIEDFTLKFIDDDFLVETLKNSLKIREAERISLKNLYQKCQNFQNSNEFIFEEENSKSQKLNKNLQDSLEDNSEIKRDQQKQEIQAFFFDDSQNSKQDQNYFNENYKKQKDSKQEDHYLLNINKISINDDKRESIDYLKQDQRISHLTSIKPQNFYYQVESELDSTIFQADDTENEKYSLLNLQKQIYSEKDNYPMIQNLLQEQKFALQLKEISQPKIPKIQLQSIGQKNQENFVEEEISEIMKRLFVFNEKKLQQQPLIQIDIEDQSNSILNEENYQNFKQKNSRHSASSYEILIEGQSKILRDIYQEQKQQQTPRFYGQQEDSFRKNSQNSKNSLSEEINLKQKELFSPEIKRNNSNLKHNDFSQQIYSLKVSLTEKETPIQHLYNHNFLNSNINQNISSISQDNVKNISDLHIPKARQAKTIERKHYRNYSLNSDNNLSINFDKLPLKEVYQSMAQLNPNHSVKNFDIRNNIYESKSLYREKNLSQLKERLSKRSVDRNLDYLKNHQFIQEGQSLEKNGKTITRLILQLIFQIYNGIILKRNFEKIKKIILLKIVWNLRFFLVKIKQQIH